MTTDIWVWTTVALLTVASVALAGTLWRVRRQGQRDLLAARAETASVAARLDLVEQSLAGPADDVPDEAAGFVITHVGESPGPGPVPTEDPSPVGGALFADLVLRETVVKTAGLAHGVRRALSPENRFRIRHEYRRTVRASRKQRRIELREARRRMMADRRADDTTAA